MSSRVVALLEGESLLNDASALVILRSAIAGLAASVPLWGVVGNFLYSVALALAFGLAVGWLNLRVRARIEDSTVNTLISFTLPFIASLPVELLGGSGLVAAVVAGLITGSGAPRSNSPARVNAAVPLEVFDGAGEHRIKCYAKPMTSAHYKKHLRNVAGALFLHI